MQVVTTVLTSVQQFNVGALGAILDNPEPWWYNQVMRAWLMDSYKGVEQLRLGEVPDPQHLVQGRCCCN